jgi:hypothetical protein
MTLTQAMKTTKTHIAEAGRLTLCGKPSTPVKFVGEGQARVMRDGSRARLCGQCLASLEAAERKGVV